MMAKMQQVKKEARILQTGYRQASQERKSMKQPKTNTSRASEDRFSPRVEDRLIGQGRKYSDKKHRQSQKSLRARPAELQSGPKINRSSSRLLQRDTSSKRISDKKYIDVKVEDRLTHQGKQHLISVNN